MNAEGSPQKLAGREATRKGGGLDSYAEYWRSRYDSQFGDRDGK